MATKKPKGAAKSKAPNKSEKPKSAGSAKSVTENERVKDEEIEITAEIEAVEDPKEEEEEEEDEENEDSEAEVVVELSLDKDIKEGDEKNIIKSIKISKPKSSASKDKVISSEVVENKPLFSGFFSKKYEEHESILTIFKIPKFYGALLGEVLGTMFITLLLFSLSLMGLSSLATYSFVVIAIYIGIYAFSKACLNPIITVGMMATRRMSVIRGVMYIIAEIIGAWLGWLIFNSFHLAGGDSAYATPTMEEIGEGKFLVVAMIEFMAAIIVAFFYARALKYKKSIFTFAAVVTGGFAFVMVVSYVISAAFLSLSSNFVVNPAAALMFQIFPTSGEDFGEIFGGICQALSVYVILPAVGGILGFYLSDFTARLSGENE